jgi:hypothetical protein
LSFDLFNLLPAVYRIRDAQIAQSQQLLTPTEASALATLQAIAPGLLSADQQAELDKLTAKASRGPLASLVMLIQEQLAILAEDLDQLYDDQFIETCAKWVIPYIGDLIGYQSIHGIAPSVDNPRSEVAETISLRRRKGTVLVMEQLARDVTAWGAHAVEFFRVLADTQYMNHIRLHNYYAPDLRRWQPGLYIDTGFDETAHKVDVRRIAPLARRPPRDTAIPDCSGATPQQAPLYAEPIMRPGRYNIQNIGIFLWSLNAYSITQGPVAASVDPLCFRFNPLGMDMPLFHRAVSPGEEIVAPATPVNVADRLRRRVLCADLEKGIGASYYGEGNSLALYLDGQLVNAYEIRVANLSGADGAWLNRPASGAPYKVAVDPELGRLALRPPPIGSQPPPVGVSYYYGFNADIGGGEYSRAASFTVQDPAWVFPFPDTAGPPRYHTLQDALTFAVGQLPIHSQVAIEITDGDTYSAAGGLTADLPPGTTLELRAADETRPTILLNGELSVTGDASSTFLLNGLLIGAGPTMAPATPSPAALVHVPASRPNGHANSLSEIRILHCTLVPGWSVDSHAQPQFASAPNFVAEPAGLLAKIDKSIVGAIRAEALVNVCAYDSIIDATDRTLIAYAGLDGVSGGGSLSLQGCTVIGKAHASLLDLVSDSIFWGGLLSGDSWATPLIADRKQQGCVRFSFLPEGAETPRRFECVEQTLGGPQPIFFALRYGRPGYAKLLASTTDLVRRGADDGGEMGAFHFVLAPLRETDLRVRMQEYLPVGLEFGIIYQN